MYLVDGGRLAMQGRIAAQPSPKPSPKGKRGRRLSRAAINRAHSRAFCNSRGKEPK